MAISIAMCAWIMEPAAYRNIRACVMDPAAKSQAGH
jgi:hypothetical protein